MIIDKFEFPNGDAQFYCSDIIKHIMDSNPTHSRKVPADYVWDENQSVKWNRERTEEYNAHIDDTNRSNRKDIYESLCNLDNALIDWLVEDVNFLVDKENQISRDMVVRIYQVFKDEKGSSEVYDHIRFMSSILSAIINTEK